MKQSLTDFTDEQKTKSSVSGTPSKSAKYPKLLNVTVFARTV